jgi:hypothetical protein
MLVDGKAGERNVFKRRTEADDMDNPEGKRQRLRLVVDVSGSMTRFNGSDGRLNRSLEAVMVVMEALAGQEHRIDVSIQGHSGDTPSIELTEWGKFPTNRARRLAVCPGRPGRLSTLSVFLCKSVLYGAFVWTHRALNSQKRRFPARAVRAMVTHSAYCWSGDFTVEGIQRGVRECAERAASVGDEGGGSFVLALSDANLRRYGIQPEELGAALTWWPICRRGCVIHHCNLLSI